MFDLLRELFAHLTNPRLRRLSAAQRMTELSWYALQAERVEEAQSQAKSALKICYSLVEPGADLSDADAVHCCLRQCLQILVCAHLQAGQLDAAMHYGGDLEKIYQQSADDNRRLDLLHCLHVVGQALLKARRYDEARAFFRSHWSLTEEVHGEDSPQMATSLLNLAQLELAAERYDAWELWRKMSPPADEEMIYAECKLALIEALQGNFPVAETRFQELLQRIKRRSRDVEVSTSLVAEVLRDYAYLLRETNRKAEALALEQQASEL
jgi:tetratricopeptide (TPR) repeat protein